MAKADREDHDAEEHKQVTCPNCNFSEVKFKYKNHEEVCAMKPQKCPFCEQVLDMARYGDHVELCGSKTSKCDECGEYVKLKDREMHVTMQFCEQFRLKRKQ